MAKEKVFAVIGLGTFGRKVCEIITDRGGRVIAIDNDATLIDRIKDTATQAILLDATDVDSLTDAPLDDVDVAVVAIGDNIAASILTTALLKRVGVPYILARAISELHEQVLKQIGADEIVNIEIDEGIRIGSKLMSPQVLDRIPVTQTVSVAELYPPKSFVGKSLAKLDLRGKFNINVIAITRVTLSIDETGNSIRKEQVIFPSGSDVPEETDVMLIVGTNEDIDALKGY
ncbi:MAG: TrkA family potassium uptake protein [Spirochaetales bacterium]|nr:TrkA family potassium uptake protein [Spirochaetales bacterium]